MRLDNSSRKRLPSCWRRRVIVTSVVTEGCEKLDNDLPSFVTLGRTTRTAEAMLRRQRKLWALRREYNNKADLSIASLRLEREMRLPLPSSGSLGPQFRCRCVVLMSCAEFYEMGRGRIETAPTKAFGLFVWWKGNKTEHFKLGFYRAFFPNRTLDIYVFSFKKSESFYFTFAVLYTGYKCNNKSMLRA